MDISPYIGAIVTVVVAITGGYVAMKNAMNAQLNALSVQIAALSQQVADLKEDVEKHNHVVERVYVNERDIKTAFHQLDELKDRDAKIEARIDKLHG